MAEERKITETETETKNDVFGNPKEQKSVTTEKKEESGLFGTKETETKIERKDEE